MKSLRDNAKVEENFALLDQVVIDVPEPPAAQKPGQKAPQGASKAKAGGAAAGAAGK